MEKRKQQNYSESFKWKVVQEVLDGKFTKESAKRYYGIGSNCAILYWMRKYSGNDNYREQNQGKKDFNLMGKKLPGQMQNNRIKELEEELLREKQRADLWQKIVEVAEEEFGLDIKKKFGARPSTVSKRMGGQK
jgi:transposase